ncbi:Hydrophobic protein like, partial [Quillaja saponaria]
TNPHHYRFSPHSQTQQLRNLFGSFDLFLSEKLSGKFSPLVKQERKMKEGTANCVDIILAIILPPLGVFLKFGCHSEFWICLLLTLFGYLPGIIYAVYAITK